MSKINKYKAWSPKWKRIIEHNKDGYTIDVMNNTAWLDLVCDQNIELIQFTGLTDDIDDEIYEGDILMNINGDKRAVEWNDDTCKFQLDNGTDINDGKNYGVYQKIVSNIFIDLVYNESDK